MERKNIKKIKWDQNNIQDHNKLRRTRMKINEKKTPKKSKMSISHLHPYQS